MNHSRSFIRISKILAVQGPRAWTQKVLRRVYCIIYTVIWKTCLNIVFDGQYIGRCTSPNRKVWNEFDYDSRRFKVTARLKMANWSSWHLHVYVLLSNWPRIWPHLISVSTKWSSNMSQDTCWFDVFELVCLEHELRATSRRSHAQWLWWIIFIYHRVRWLFVRVKF